MSEHDFGLVVLSRDVASGVFVLRMKNGADNRFNAKFVEACERARRRTHASARRNHARTHARSLAHARPRAHARKRAQSRSRTRLRAGAGARTRMQAWHSALDVVQSSTGVAALVTIGEGKFYSNGLDLEWHRSAIGISAFSDGERRGGCADLKAPDNASRPNLSDHAMQTGSQPFAARSQLMGPTGRSPSMATDVPGENVVRALGWSGSLATSGTTRLCPSSSSRCWAASSRWECQQCAGHALDMRMRHTLDMHWECGGHAVGMYRTCAGYALGMRWTCIRHASDMRWTCVGHVLDMCLY